MLGEHDRVVRDLVHEGSLLDTPWRLRTCNRHVPRRQHASDRWSTYGPRRSVRPEVDAASSHSARLGSCHSGRRLDRRSAAATIVETLIVSEPYSGSTSSTTCVPLRSSRHPRPGHTGQGDGSRLLRGIDSRSSRPRSLVRVVRRCVRTSTASSIAPEGFTTLQGRALFERWGRSVCGCVFRAESRSTMREWERLTSSGCVPPDQPYVLVDRGIARSACASLSGVRARSRT